MTGVSTRGTNARVSGRGNRNVGTVQPSAGSGSLGWWTVAWLRRLGARSSALGESQQSRSAFGAGPPPRTRVLLAASSLRDWPGAFASQVGAVSVTGAALSKGQVRVAWQAPHFCKARRRFRGRRRRFCGQVQFSWQAQHLEGFRGRPGADSAGAIWFWRRCSTFARSCADFVASAALSQGQAQVPALANFRVRIRRKRACHRRGGDMRHQLP